MNQIFNLSKIIFKIDINIDPALVYLEKVEIMSEKDKILKKLDERLAKGEISEELYKEIVSRYEKEEDLEIGEDMSEDVEDISEEKKTEDKTEKTERVSISGASKIDGCNCEIFRAAGASKVNGDLRADDADVSGATKINGNAYFGKLDSSGALKVRGKSEGKKLDLSGSAKFEDSVDVKFIDSSGSFGVKGDVNCTSMDTSGLVKIQGVLKGEEIMLNNSGKSKINKIEGGDIVVESGGSGLFSFGFGKSGSLEVESVKGNDISLENTKAESVTGNKVIIGRGCKIKNVKAKELKIHESAKVENKKSLNEIEEI